MFSFHAVERPTCLEFLTPFQRVYDQPPGPQWHARPSPHTFFFSFLPLKVPCHHASVSGSKEVDAFRCILLPAPFPPPLPPTPYHGGQVTCLTGRCQWVHWRSAPWDLLPWEAFPELNKESRQGTRVGGGKKVFYIPTHTLNPHRPMTGGRATLWGSEPDTCSLPPRPLSRGCLSCELALIVPASKHWHSHGGGDRTPLRRLDILQCLNHHHIHTHASSRNCTLHLPPTR